MADTLMTRSLSRRHLVGAAGAGAGLGVFWNHDALGQTGTPVATPAPKQGSFSSRGIDYNLVFGPLDATTVDSFLSIGEDGTVTLVSGRIEFGQGVKTGYAQLVAEELSLPFEKIVVKLGDTSEAAPTFGTYGSLSMRMGGPTIRGAAATRNAWLLEVAAEKLGDDVKRLTTADGTITGPSGSVTFAELAAGKATGREINPDVTLKDPAKYTVVGKPIARVDVPDKVTGKQVYGIDVELEGMVYGKIARPPSLDALLLGVDFTEALAMPGIVGSVHLPEKNFAAIVGERKDQVEAAIKVVKAEWQELVSDTTSENIHDRLKETADAGTSLDAEGHTADPKAALAAVGGGQTWTYKLPYLTHSPIEPKSALVNVTPEQVEVWVSTQSPFDVRTGVARTLGRDESEVVVHGMHPGGAFGSKIVPQAELEAAWMSNAVGKPVKLIWDRIEEMMFGQFRPAMRIEITAGLDTAGKIAGWNYDAYTAGYYPELAEAPTASASDWSANILELYAVETSKTTLFNGISPLPPFFWRVNGATSNTYARESTIDILAEQAGVDPITFRDGMLAEKPRLAAVMHAAVDSSGWTPGVGATGQGFGIALGFDAETPIAEVAQVEVNTETGELKILRMDIAVDPGLAVNPEAIKHQIGGGAMMSLSGAIREELTFANGKLTNGTFSQYAPIVMRDSPPTINVTVFSDPTLPMSGIGEPGVAPAVGAVANAIYDACGARLFQAPFTPERILAALAESSASPIASPAASPAS
ncbi:MAG: molybdopterin cofactor-binding domain-containing protein [Thermomicrobiales bacterium]